MVYASIDTYQIYIDSSELEKFDQDPSLEDALQSFIDMLTFWFQFYPEVNSIELIQQLKDAYDNETDEEQLIQLAQIQD